MLCRVMRVSVSGYYAWRRRLTKSPSLKRKKLADLVRDCYWENRRRYGTRRIKAALDKAGVPNLLAEVKIQECTPATLIVGDITYLRLRNGKFCYLAVWQDKVTRRIVGWSLSNEMTAETVISALKKALQKGLIKRGALIHSDRGSQYASNGFRLTLQTNGLRQSMSAAGNCFDNAQAESFFSRFKAELVEGGVFEDIEQARSEIFSYIEGYYNRVRLHSALGYLSPLEYELELKTKNGGRKESFLYTFS